MENDTDLLIDIIEYFKSRGLCKGDSIDAFRDYEPIAPDRVIIVNEYAGEGPGLQDEAVNRSLQIVTRDRSATEAKNKARRLFDSLNTLNKFVQLTEDRWSQVYLRQTPFKLKVDEERRVYYAFNIGVTTYMDKGGM